MEQIIEKNGIILQEEDAQDIKALLQEMSSTVARDFANDSPQQIFWEQQKYNSVNDKR